MNQTESIVELSAALAKAQGQIETAAKDSENPHFRSKYADLASVWAACRKALTDNGLSIIQAPSGGPELVTVTTRLMHISGQWIEDALTIRPTKQDAQGIGSAITYARRYSLMAMVGVAPEDDDGNEACQAVTNRPMPVQNPRLEEAKKLTIQITSLVNSGVITADEVKNYGQIESVNDAMKRGDVESLQSALDLLKQYVLIKTQEAQAS